MGSIMVYRYRPMRVVPTITTRVFMARGSFMRWRRHYVRLQKGSTGKRDFLRRDLYFSCAGRRLREISRNPCGSFLPVCAQNRHSCPLSGRHLPMAAPRLEAGFQGGRHMVQELVELVDLGRYPLDRPGSPAWRRMNAVSSRGSSMPMLKSPSVASRTRLIRSRSKSRRAMA